MTTDEIATWKTRQHTALAEINIKVARAASDLALNQTPMQFLTYSVEVAVLRAQYDAVRAPRLSWMLDESVAVLSTKERP